MFFTTAVAFVVKGTFVVAHGVQSRPSMQVWWWRPSMRPRARFFFSSFFCRLLSASLAEACFSRMCLGRMWTGWCKMRCQGRNTREVVQGARSGCSECLARWENRAFNCRWACLLSRANALRLKKEPSLLISRLLADEIAHGKTGDQQWSHSMIQGEWGECSVH